MHEVSPKACASHILDTVPPIMQFIRVEMRRHRTLNISVPQFRVLTFVERNPGGSLSDAAERVGLSLPAMSRLIDGLVGRGLLLRGESDEDRRRVTLHLTESGRALVRTAREGAQARLAEVLDALLAKERAQVVQAMETLRTLFVKSPVRVIDTPR